MLTIARPRRSAVVLLLAPLAIATGCGGRPAPPPPVELDACALLLPQEADTAAGETMQPMAGEVDRSQGVGDVKCTYATYDAPPRVVSLEVRRFASAAAAQGAQAQTASYLRSLAHGAVESVADLGDEAVWAGASVEQLHLRRGRLRLIVTVQLGEPGGRAAAARKIAERALQRLVDQKAL